MDLSVSKVIVSRKGVECLHTRGMHNGCDEVVCSSASECVFAVSLVDETSDEEDEDKDGGVGNTAGQGETESKVG